MWQSHFHERIICEIFIMTNLLSKSKEYPWVILLYSTLLFSQSPQNESSSILGKHVSQSQVVLYVTLILKHLNNTMP